MSLFAISDLHLALHPSLDKPMDVFDVVWTDHVDKLESNWRAAITDDDVVVIPGDISWAIDLAQAMPDLQFLDSLPGTKLLLKGNHDYWWASMAKMRGLFPSIKFIQYDCFEADDFVVCGTRGWLLPWNKSLDFTAEESEKIYKRELLRLQMSLTCGRDIAIKGKKLIAASHFPPLTPDHYRTDVTALYQQYGVDEVVYGHLHGRRTEMAVEGSVDGIVYHLVAFDKLDAMPKKIL